MASAVLKRGREKSLLRRHPWVFSNAIARIEGDPKSGETVEILADDGRWLGRGAYSPQSQIAIRVWTFDPDEEVTPELFRDRLARAMRAREAVLARTDVTACRLVYAESDGLPGLIVDRYGDYLVCQFAAAGVERWKADIVRLLTELGPGTTVYERSDLAVRRKEGLAERTGVLAGQEPPELVEVREGPCTYLVDIRGGHKTGFYLDQRENRALVAAYSHGAEVLNGFAYTGAFGIAALQSGAAHVTNVESSASLLALGQRHVERNGIDPSRVDHVEGNVFEVLRKYRDQARQFDVIVLDPPKFAESQRQVERASRAYKDVNLWALKLVRPGGLLFTFSCSGHVKRSLFQKIVADAALDAEREVQIVHWLTQGPDHPTALSFPEGTYLKGLACRVW